MQMMHMSSKVYFVDLRARSYKDSKIAKIADLFDAAGFNGILGRDMLTAIKVHFGEEGNDTFINPVFVRVVVDRCLKARAKPFITDSNTLYSGSRHNAVDHLETALKHGYSFATVNAPLVIADGLSGKAAIEVPIKDGKHFKTVTICEAIVESRAMLVLSHFKGHELAGFGGALKNLAMGCAPAKGKKDQHNLKFVVDEGTCISCGACIKACPVQAISFTKERKARIKPEICIGCGECVTVCPVKAIGMDWNTSLEPFTERMIEYAKGAVAGKEEHVGYINFLMNITPDCDCAGWSDAPLVPDIGILPSKDPVALDKACWDMVNQQTGFKASLLQAGHAPGEDKFKGVWNYTMGELQLSLAEKLGLGSTKYSLVDLS